MNAKEQETSDPPTAGDPNRKRLAIVASHVIQYQDPFFRQLAKAPGIDLTVIYGSLHGATSFSDTDMKTTLRWNLDLLQGYRYQVLRSFGGNVTKPLITAVNPGIAPALLQGRFDAVIFMLGWGSITSLLGILTCVVGRIPFFLYGDSSFPPPERSVRMRLRAGVMRALFGLTTGFMVSGVKNAEYYLHYGADPSRCFLLPWAVENERFESASRLTPEERHVLRASYGIPEGTLVIAFSAKLVARKDPMTLLRAYESMRLRARAAILFLGDGELRTSLAEYARSKGLSPVIFAGFINQEALPRMYAISDVLVLPSVYEPRGAVINEAMACGLPVITSDRCGAVGDIVRHRENGFVFAAGDHVELAKSLDRLAESRGLQQSMGNRSREIIAGWNFQRGVDGIVRALRWLGERDRLP